MVQWRSPPSLETKKAQLDIFADVSGEPAPSPKLPAVVPRPAPPSQVEILPRKRPREVDAPDHLTEGQLEHAYLVHRADRYEDRCVQAVRAYCFVAVAAVLAKGGIKISELVLERYNMPIVYNTRLLPGMLGAITLIFAFTVIYYALRVQQYRPQKYLRLVEPSLAGRTAGAMLYVSYALLVSMFALVMFLTFTDTLFMVTFLFDHYFYTLDGWEIGYPAYSR